LESIVFCVVFGLAQQAENQLEDKSVERNRPWSIAYPIGPIDARGGEESIDARGERREEKMLRFTARASLRGGNCVISRLLSTSIATIDTLPKNLVIDDASVLKEDSSKKK